MWIRFVLMLLERFILMISFFHESTQLSAMTSCPSHLQLIMNTHNNHPDYLQPSKGWQHFQYPHHTTSSQPQPLNPTTLSFLQSLFNITTLHTESLILELPLLISQQPKIRATAYFNHLHLLEYSFQNSQSFTNKHFKLPITFSKLLNLITLDQFFQIHDLVTFTYSRPLTISTLRLFQILSLTWLNCQCLITLFNSQDP